MTRPPELGTWWQHKNGRCYKVLLITNLHPTARRPTTVVYQSLGGELYSRPLSAWYSGMTRIYMKEKQHEC